VRLGLAGLVGLPEVGCSSDLVGIAERVTFEDPIVLRRPRVWTPTDERLRPPTGPLEPSGRPAPGSPAHGAAGRRAVCSRRGSRRSQRLEGASAASRSSVVSARMLRQAGSFYHPAPRAVAGSGSLASVNGSLVTGTDISHRPTGASIRNQLAPDRPLRGPRGRGLWASHLPQ
jgi:hypothetical protein